MAGPNVGPYPSVPHALPSLPADASLAAPPLPPLPFTGTLEKLSGMMGIWQQRTVRVDRGSLRYFKDVAVHARGDFGPGDVLGVGTEPPATLRLRLREAGGEERTYLLRAASEEDARMWAGLIRQAFGLSGDVPSDSPDRSSRGRSVASLASGSSVASFVGRAASASASAVGIVARATGREDWLDDTLGSVRASFDGKVGAAKASLEKAQRSTVRWREQLGCQMDEALTSCDEGAAEMLLDSALAYGLVGDRAPAAVRRAARRAAGRGLRDATLSGDPRRLKGALVAARRLQAVDVPEFEPAVAKYKEVRRLPEGWDVARMVTERRHGRAKLLCKSDVSGNFALRALVQLMFDRTLRRVETRDRHGEPMPERLDVVQVVQVENEEKWVDYLVRREAVKGDVRDPATRALPAGFLFAAADTERALVEAEALARAGERVCVPAGAAAGAPLRATSALTGEALRLTVPRDAGGEGTAVPLEALLAPALPGPALETAANEAWLFHGTRPIAAESITSDAFKLDLAGSSSGSLLGRGIYAAENCTKADEYSHADPTTGLHTLLLCRVTLGRLLYTDEVTPDPRRCEEACGVGARGGTDGECHAVLGDRRKCRGTFREFCVFDEDQIYPNFIVHYRRVVP